MNQLKFYKAEVSEVNEILDLYNELLDDLESNINYPKWTKGYYPNLSYLLESAKKGELFIVRDRDKIVSSVILNNKCIKDYDNVDWTFSIDIDNLLYMHTFAIRNNLRGKGLGKEVLDLIIDYCKKNNIKSLRLDTIKGNIPAEHFYSKNGFNHLGVYELDYEETDEKYFNLYEYNL